MKYKTHTYRCVRKNTLFHTFMLSNPVSVLHLISLAGYYGIMMSEHLILLLQSHSQL